MTEVKKIFDLLKVRKANIHLKIKLSLPNASMQYYFISSSIFVVLKDKKYYL